MPFPLSQSVPVTALLLLLIGCKVEPVQPIEDAPQTVEPATVAADPGLALRLPTSNSPTPGDEGAFYMRVQQDTVHGLRQAGWEAGQYGFVRDVVRTPVGRTFNRLHEGLDIAPLGRDANGEPLDTVRAAYDGVVAYTFKSGASAFGRHLVVEHDWGAGPVYTLYAHLNEVSVSEGDSVAAEDPIGRLGYTGRFINRERAHVHFEVDLMLNGDISAWLRRHYGRAVPHGNFFGTNLAGLNPTALLEAAKAPDFDFAQYVRSRPVGYRVAVPGDRPLDLLNRYPWMRTDRPAASDSLQADIQGGTGSWEVAFTQAGVPIGARRIAREVTGPTVTFVSDEIRRGHLSTNQMLVRRGDDYQVSRPRGMRYFGLLTTTPDSAPW
jgi:murein DD-endopeptidase MepM/ murein hydrolase activator NlpD